MEKIVTKVTSAIITAVLVFSNLLVLGGEVIAYGGELEEQNSKTNNSKVEFDSYFEDGLHGKKFKTTEGGKIYLNLKVKDEGYLKDIVVNFSNANFKIDSDKLNSEYVQKVNDNKDTVTLSLINKGEDVTLEVPITMLNEETIKADNFSKVTDVVLSATYIDINGKEKAITKTIKNQVEWNGTSEVENTATLSKYIPYNMGEEYGVLIQTIVSNKVKDDTMPIKTEKTTIEVPEINGIKPESVKVIANKTSAANGKNDGVDFTSDNYNYDKENGKVEITVKNEPNDQNNIAWKKGETDEFVVTYLFKGKEVYDFVQNTELKGTLKLNVSMELYNNTDLTIDKEFQYDYTLTEKIGDLNTVNIETDEKISKGYIYTNYTAEEKTETTYNQTYLVSVADIDLAEEITLVQTADQFKDSEGNAVLSNGTINKKIKVKEEVFKKILGEDGFIEVVKEDNTVVGTINKDTQKDESGNLVLDISSENLNTINIKTNKPVTEGILEIQVEKAIKSELDSTKEQMQKVTTLTSEVTLKSSIEDSKGAGNTIMEEPVSKAKVTINKQDLTTVAVNENVEIRAVLDTSNLYNALYVNPIIELELPEYIKEINIKSSKLLFEEELTVKEAKLIERNGKKIIRIELDGTQTTYNTENPEIEGATIVISADITLDELTPRTSSAVTMYYTNENTDLYEEATEDEKITAEVDNTVNTVGVTKADVNLVVPTGVMATSAISNYREGASDVISITDEAKDVELAPFEAKRTATIKGNIINNHENTISGVSVLGRFPSQGNKKIDSSDDLGSTTTFNVTKAISVLGIDTSKVEIYYSEKADANKNIDDTTNGWTTSPSDLTKVKSYLIVLKDSIATAGTVEFNYEIELPENIGYNKSASAMYKVYYTNEAEEATTQDEKTAPILNLTTGEGPELEIDVTSSAAEDKTVFNGQYVRFYVTVKNVGDIDATNAKLVVKAPENAQLVERYEDIGTYGVIESGSTTVDLGTIKVGETVTEYYEIQAYRNLKVESNEIVNTIGITADNITGEIKSEEYKLSINEDAKRMELTNTAVDVLEDFTYQTGQSITYRTEIYNQAEEDMNTAVLTIPIPSGSNVTDTYIQKDGENLTEGITVNNDSVVVSLGTIAAGGSLRVYTTFTLGDNLPESFSTKVSLTDGTYTYLSNERDIYTGKVSIEAEQTAPLNQYVKEREIFNYAFNISAKGNTDVRNLVLEVTLPEEVSYSSTTVVRIGTDEAITSKTSYDKENRKVTITVSGIAANTSIGIYVYVKAELLTEDDDGKAITNSATVRASNISEITLNPVTHYLEYNPKQEEGENDTNGYKISGTAWLDTNKNGQRDSDEATLSNVRVMLLYKENNQLVTSDSGERLITTTDNSGKYEFKNLKSNKYLVVFVYDTSRYTITTYQQDGVLESVNSDAINMEVILDGEKTQVGMTDTITVRNSNVRNIDIGLYGEEKFDLRLDKYISKITLTTPTIGTREYTYDNSTFEKIEILRQNADKSSIVIEYKIVVTNEGAIPGYVNRVVDYLPDDVNFSTELNSDWYTSKNSGVIYNTSLSNEKLNPGESKELTLVITKKITSASIGSVVSNKAEIYEATNEAGLPDIDSEQGNMLESEDDLGTANIILSVVTGKIIGYTAIFIIAAGIIIAGIIIIKKKVLPKRK